MSGGLRYVKNIIVTFHPFDKTARGAREFFRQVSASPSVATNPKAKLKANVLEKEGNPTVDIELTNGEKITFDPASDLQVDDILGPLTNSTTALHMKTMSK